jgi:hypothetical protein
MRAPEEKETSDGSWLSVGAEVVVVVVAVVLLAAVLDVLLSELPDFAGAASFPAQPDNTNDTRAIPIKVRGIHDSCRSLKTFRPGLYDGR